MAGFNLDEFLTAARAAPTSQTSIQDYMSFEKHKQDIENSNQNMEERKHYAECIYMFTCVWCLFLLIVLFGKGLNKLDLSDEIIITFITSTTVNVFVFFRYVTKYLFNSEKST